MKDNEIISLFELRDEHAIEALSDKYHPYCYKIAWNLLTNKEDSEECLNDTWFSVWSLIPPKKPSVLSHFCGRITRNLSIDRLRKKYADRRPDLHMADVLGEMDHLSVTYTIEDQLAEKELLEIINDFLGKMKLAVTSFLMVRDMNTLRMAEQNGEFTVDDQVVTARIYAKEVEHSEWNLEYMADEFLFGEAYTPENLCVALTRQ